MLDKLKEAIPKGVVDNTSKIVKSESTLKAAEEALKNLKNPTATSRILSSAKALVPYFAPEIGKYIDKETGIELPIAQTAGTAWLLKKTRKNVVANGFWEFMKKKMPGAAAKQLTKAGIRHGAAASTGIGAHPAVQLAMLVGDVGLSAYAIKDLWDEYQKTTK